MRSSVHSSFSCGVMRVVAGDKRSAECRKQEQPAVSDAVVRAGEGATSRSIEHQRKYAACKFTEHTTGMRGSAL